MAAKREEETETKVDFGAKVTLPLAKITQLLTEFAEKEAPGYSVKGITFNYNWRRNIEERDLEGAVVEMVKK